MKIAINRKPHSGPWGGGNHFVRAIFDSVCKGNYVSTSLDADDIDIIFLMDPRPEGSGFGINEAISYRQTHPNSRIVQRINECDARKNTEHMDSLLLQCSSFNDYTLFVSNWMREYFKQKGWACQHSSVCYNGVNDEYLSMRKNHDVVRQKDKKIKVVTHHWSNNLLKGFDVYDFLDYLSVKRDDVEFTYIGRHRGTFKNTKCIEPLSGRALAEELSRHDIYFSGSRNDPGPNHILESLALGIPTYVHSEGGGCVEFALQGPKDKDKIFSNFVELESIIDFDNHYQNTMIPETWSHSMTNVWNVLEKISSKA